MRAVRARGNQADVALGRELHRRGLRFRRYLGIPGKPDIVFPRPHVAVFVDGDFWHGRLLIERGPDALEASLKTDRREWWVAKITATVVRDRRVDAKLADEGWTVTRLWEREILANVSQAADVVCSILYESDSDGAWRRAHSDSSRPRRASRSANRRARRSA